MNESNCSMLSFAKDQENELTASMIELGDAKKELAEASIDISYYRGIFFLSCGIVLATILLRFVPNLLSSDIFLIAASTCACTSLAFSVKAKSDYQATTELVRMSESKIRSVAASSVGYMVGYFRTEKNNKHQDIT